MKNDVILSSLALDLKRIALSYHRRSYSVGDRFVAETDRWIRTLDRTHMPPYVLKLLSRLEKSLRRKDKKRVAEDALMYSTILQNFVGRK